MLNRFYFLLLACALCAGGCATSGLGKRGQEKVLGKTYVVTGASSGFGKGVAIQLASYKANVVICSRDKEGLEDVAKQIWTAGGKALVVVADVSKPEDMQQLADQAVKEFSRVDCWINNAGVGAIGEFWDIPLEEHSRLIDVNLKGVIYGSHIALKMFRKQGYGTLINVGSVESEVPLAYHASYAASKGGVRNLSQALNHELRLNGDKNIKVVTIMPWAADTPFWRHASNKSGGTPRMALMDPPEKIVNAIVWSSVHRRQELSVGWKAKLANKFHHMMPHFTERISANVVHRYQIETAPPAPPTQGILFKADEGANGVDDGVRARMKRERKERKEKDNR